jgi:hypothetical protein
MDQLRILHFLTGGQGRIGRGAEEPGVDLDGHRRQAELGVVAGTATSHSTMVCPRLSMPRSSSGATP